MVTVCPFSSTTLIGAAGGRGVAGVVGEVVGDDVVADGVLGCARGCGFAADVPVVVLRVGVPRRLVWATEVADTVRTRTNERAPRAVFIRNSQFLSG